MTEGNSKKFEMAVGTSSVIESGMMEGENFYTPIETTNESETASQTNWSGTKNDTGQLCRSCANSSDYFIPIYEGEGLEHQLEYKIQKHLPIQVSSTDTLPLQLCYQCASTLIAWDSMISSCLEAEKKLKAMQEAAEDSKISELYEESHVEDVEMPDSDDEPLITSKTKLMLEKNKATPIKKKILSKAKSKTVPLKNDKTATNSKDGDDKERTSLEENFKLDFILELNDINKTMDDTQKKVSTTYGIEEVKEVNLDINNELRDKKLKIKREKDEEALRCLVNENDIDSIIKEANRLRGVKIMSGKSIKGAGSTPYLECPLCQKVIEKSAVDDHMCAEHNVKRKETTVKCDVCRKDFANKVFLQRHIQSVHEKIIKAKCKICNKSFTDRSNYKQHLLIHSGVKSYICQICGKGFVQSQGLRMHMPSHSDSYPFSCSLCSKRFRRKQHYELHMEKHTGKKSHQCETCGKFFTVKNELKIHSWIHKEEWPYVCQHCNKGFNQSCGLKLHLKNHHALGS